MGPYGRLLLIGAFNQAVSEIWRASAPNAGELDGTMWAVESAPPLVVGWWSACVLMLILMQIRGLVSENANTASAGIRLCWWDIAYYVAGIIAAALALAVVNGIDARQEKKAARIAAVCVNQTEPAGDGTRMGRI